MSFILVSFLTGDVNLNLKTQKKARFVGNGESSSNSETIQNSKSENVSELIKDKGNRESNSCEESQLESSDGVMENDQQNSSNEDSADDYDDLLSDRLSGAGENDNTSDDEEAESDKGSLKWKKDLLSKAREAYDRRNKRGTSLRKLVYSDLPLDHDKGEKSEDAQKDNENYESSKFGGLFQLAKKKEALLMNHRVDSSLPDNRGPVKLSCDWSDTLIAPTIKNLFVTGGWGEQDAKALLEEDEAMYGDFEDLETGDKHGSSAAAELTKDGQGESLEDEEQKRLKKKKSLKAAFDVEYDDKTGGEGGYLEDLKREVSEQEQRNRAEFEGLDEQTRVQYEGFRPGTYVRMEIKGSYSRIMCIIVLYLLTYFAPR